MNNVEVFVFLGCKTASDSLNITKDAVIQGASSVIGWAQSVSANSHSYWLARFVDELSTGSTIYQAKHYADSFNYNDNDVKTDVIEGNSLTMLSSASLKSLSSLQVTSDSEIQKVISEDRKKDRKIKLDKEIKLDNISNLKENLELIKAIKNTDISFNITNYTIYSNENG